MNLASALVYLPFEREETAFTCYQEGPADRRRQAHNADLYLAFPPSCDSLFFQAHLVSWVLLGDPELTGDPVANTRGLQLLLVGSVILSANIHKDESSPGIGSWTLLLSKQKLIPFWV